MLEASKLDNLILMSNEIGQNIAFVQGGGGNTSVKLDGERMAIKASGISLQKMSLEQGIAIVDYPQVNQYHLSPDATENAYADSINNFAISNSGRPSIETGFHALLGKYVIHSHSVFVNVLLCSEQGKKLISQHFPQAIWIDYCTPGRDLTLAIKDGLEFSTESYEGLVFLESHGMIASAETHQKCLDLHSECNDRVRSLFDLKDFRVFEDIDFIKPDSFLFPDQVIYMSPDQLQARTKASLETLSTAEYLLSSMAAQGLTPKYLSDEKIGVLNNMQSEKYRKNLSK
jgi:rhamnose utilization protein RhaD (predicted bifunctional aldolase and dehydrogenase)